MMQALTLDRVGILERHCPFLGKKKKKQECRLTLQQRHVSHVYISETPFQAVNESINYYYFYFLYKVLA